MSEVAVAEKSLAVIHTVTGLVPVFEKLLAEHLPGWKPFNIVDESLLRNTIKTGTLQPVTMRRLATYVGSAIDAGADAILVTCSSLGPAVDAAAPLSSVPLVRVDIGMADEALRLGSRVGVLATLSTTLEPTAALVRRRAHNASRAVEITSHLCDGAFQLLASGDQAGHDAKIVDGLRALNGKVDAIVLAQASMARALAALPESERQIPVLTSPELGVRNLKAVLSSAKTADRV